MYKKICFTGHRTLKNEKELKEKLSDLIEKFISEGTKVFICGGALGFDMMCEEVVLKMRENYSDIELHIIMPCPEELQTAKWKSEQKEKYHSILQQADSIEVCSDSDKGEYMRIRNKRLVDLADFCICYFNERDKRSGTAQTFNFAKKKGLMIINLYAD